MPTKIKLKREMSTRQDNLVDYQELKRDMCSGQEELKNNIKAARSEFDRI
jgi:hypothetical protein